MSNKQVALVVGASRGIGRQVAIDLAKYDKYSNLWNEAYIELDMVTPVTLPSTRHTFTH
jgi:hypothetical protein